MKSKLLYSQLLGLLMIFAIIGFSVPLLKDKIPKKLKTKVEQTLKKHNLNWVAVRANGRDIILSGVAPTIEEHNQALDLTQKIMEVRLVTDKITPTVISPYSMSINYRDKTLSLKGYMPSKESLNNLLKIVDKTFESTKVINQIDIGTGQPKEWEKLVSLLALVLEKLNLGVVNIIDTQVNISGQTNTTQTKEKIISSLNHFKDIGYSLKIHIVALDESAKVCQEKFNKILSSNKIVFEAGKSIVKPTNQKLLKSLVDISSLCPEVKIDILGYTDSKGDDNKNRELSLSRAKAVVAKLFQLGISLDRMNAIGMGESNPIASNSTPEGRAKNRRIEFKVKGDK